jgi:hypothetical protein
MHDWERKEAFGLRSSDKWPDEGIDPILIHGVMHRIRAKHELTKEFSRRAVATCPFCLDEFCAGHIGQHLQACKEV